jgi:hypothetical protein
LYNPRSSAAILLAVITALAAWFACINNTYLVIINAASNGFTIPEALGKFFSHGTILTNLLVAIDLSILLIFPHSNAAKFFSKPFTAGAVALYILMVGVAYNTLMRQYSNAQGWNEVDNELLHVVVPILYFLYWLFFASKDSLQWKDAFKWLIWVAIYFSYLIIRGAIDGFYPYTFLNVTALGYPQTLLRAAISGVAIIALGIMLVEIGKTQKKKYSEVSI